MIPGMGALGSIAGGAGGITGGAGGISPSSSSSATNGDFGAQGPQIMGMTIGTPAASTADKAIYAAAFVVFLIVALLVWKK